MKSLSLFICSVVIQAGVFSSAYAQQTGPLFDGKTLDGWTTTDGSPVTRGWEEWEMTEDHKVQSSLGWFDAEDYQRQIAGI